MKGKDADKKAALSLLDTYFREEAPQMVRFAARLLESPGAAEVAVQDCFVHALEHIEQFSSSPNRIGWLYEALKHIIQHAIRDRQTYLKHIVQSDDVLQLYPPHYDQYSQGLLDEQDDPDLQLLIQHYIYGYSLKELAKYYRKDVGAIKMWIKRAKERMKDRL